MVAFGDSAMPKGFLQESPSLNHQRHSLDECRYVGLLFHHPHLHRNPGTAAVATTAAPPLLLMLMITLKARTGFFSSWRFFWFIVFEEKWLHVADETFSSVFHCSRDLSKPLGFFSSATPSPFPVEVLRRILPNAQFLLRFPTSPPRRHGTLSRSRTVSRHSPRRRSVSCPEVLCCSRPRHRVRS